MITLIIPDNWDMVDIRDANDWLKERVMGAYYHWVSEPGYRPYSRLIITEDSEVATLFRLTFGL